MEVFKMPTTSAFKTGVRFDALYNRLPEPQRSRAGSWTQKIPAMGFRLASTYCSHKNDINQAIVRSAPHPSKVFYVDAREVQRKYPDLAEEIGSMIEALPGDPVVEEAVVVDAGGGSGTVSEPAANEVLDEIALSDGERFVGADGQIIPLRVYGVRTMKGIRFDLQDMHEAFRSSQQNPCNASSTPSMATIRGASVCQRNVVDIWKFVALVNHFGRHGNENAKLVNDWVVDTIFNAQYGDGVSIRQADHAAGVGGAIPIEFGKDVCGSYAYSFLEGSDNVLESVPSLKRQVLEMGIEDEPWSLWKGGHSEHMRGRLQAADVKAMLSIHPDTRISRGYFWNIPNKQIAANVEKAIRTNVVCDYRVRLDEHPNLTELFVLLVGKEKWLYEEGLGVSTKALSGAIERSETSDLKMEIRHRDEISRIREENATLLAEKDSVNSVLLEEIAKLRDDKVKLAHAAARMLCPRKKLAHIGYDVRNLILRLACPILHRSPIYI
jgi:hypothetical protein